MPPLSADKCLMKTPCSDSEAYRRLNSRLKENEKDREQLVIEYWHMYEPEKNVKKNVKNIFFKTMTNAAAVPFSLIGEKDTTEGIGDSPGIQLMAASIVHRFENENQEKTDKEKLSGVLSLLKLHLNYASKNLERGKKRINKFSKELIKILVDSRAKKLSLPDVIERIVNESNTILRR